MNNIIVTIMNRKNSLHCDMELPTDGPTGELAEFISDALTNYGAGYAAGDEDCLICYKNGRYIMPEATLKNAGIMNGDALVLAVSRRKRGMV